MTMKSTMEDRITEWRGFSSQPVDKVLSRISKPSLDQHDLGQGLIEYALILSLVAVVIVAIATLMGSAIKQAFCEPLISLNPEYASSCIEAPQMPSSPEQEASALSGLAVYSSSRGNLYIAARVPEGSSATLTVTGYGEMQYLPQKDVYVLVISTSDPPSTVTITSSAGATTTIDVIER
jgi:hypothetical protein